jgi:hypothetical protein
MMKRILLVLSLLIIVTACEDIIEVEDISDDSVTLLAPTNEAILSITNLTFTWQAIEDAESYHIQIATPSFSEALQIVTDSTIVNTSFSTNLETNSYQWRVRAENSGYQTLYTTQSFTIED